MTVLAVLAVLLLMVVLLVVVQANDDLSDQQRTIQASVVRVVCCDCQESRLDAPRRNVRASVVASPSSCRLWCCWWGLYGMKTTWMTMFRCRNETTCCGCCCGCFVVADLDVVVVVVVVVVVGVTMMETTTWMMQTRVEKRTTWIVRCALSLSLSRSVWVCVAREGGVFLVSLLGCVAFRCVWCCLFFFFNSLVGVFPLFLHTRTRSRSRCVSLSLSVCDSPHTSSQLTNTRHCVV